jgi:hypothetical protein
MVKIFPGNPGRARIRKGLIENIGCAIKGMGAKPDLGRAQ